MIGAASLESAVLGHYADFVRGLRPEASTPGFYQAERLFADVRRLRTAMGNEAFFAQLGRAQEADSGWGSLGSGWDAESFEAAMEAPPTSDERIHLVGDLVDAFFQSARDLAVTGSEGFVALDEGLSIMSKHAQALGYDAVILFLDELILWLASHAGDLAFINREGQKVAKLVEAMTADRPIPIVSFIARQRDLRELVGEHLPGAEHLGFADVLNWWEARFDQITLEDRNLPVIVEMRLLRPKSAEAARQLQDAYQKTARVHEEVMNTLLTRGGDRDMFRQVYPFSPALMQTLVAVSSLLQRERTALKLLLLLLVNQRDSLELGDLVPVGDLFDVIAEGDEPFTQAMRINFDNAKKLYRQKLLPMIEADQSVTAQDVRDGRVEVSVAQRFHNDDRLLKTLLLSALAPEVEALHAMTPARLAALNHGTVRSPIPGQEGAIVLQRCRNWAAQVGEIKISDDGPSPTISLHIVGVDTDGILANAQNVDSYGNRIQKIRSLLYEQLGIDPEETSLLPPRYDFSWRGTTRTCEILFQNVRELPLESLKAQDPWRIVIDYPFDREGYTPRDDRAKVQEFQATGESSNGLVWLPCFFALKTREDLGRLVLLDYVLSGNNLNQCGGHLSQLDREQARVLLQNQRDQMRQRMRNAMLAAYGISTMHRDAIDISHDLEEHFISLNPALALQPPVGATLREALEHLFSQALAQQFPAHPQFGLEVKRPALRRVLDILRRATQVRDGRVEVERPYRDEVRQIAVPLRLGDMGETHFVLRDDWKSHFLRKKAEAAVSAVTVRHLRAWIDQPEVMGLTRDLQNLIILSYALQHNLTFCLHGGPVEPQLETLDDALELREQVLPDEAVWQQARQRAEEILGIVPAPLLTATNVAKFAADVRVKADQHRQAIDRLCSGLRQYLDRLGIDVRSAARLQTAQAALALLRGIAGASEDDVAAVIARADVATSAAAMGQSMQKAEEMAAVLENTPWELFEKVGQLSKERAPRGPSIVDRVKEALTRDEHVVELKRSLKEAQSAALELLTSLVEVTPPPPLPVQPPDLSPMPQTAEITGSEHGIDKHNAVSVFETITNAMQADTDLVLDIKWRLYRKGRNAP
jgi:hypothetical protein